MLVHKEAKGGVWNGIQDIEKNLGDMGININSLLQHKMDGSGWIWHLEANNSFTVNSFRRLIDSISLLAADPKTKWIMWVPSKANVHLCRTLNNRLATKDNLSKRGISLPSDECRMCNLKAEDLDHVFVDCSTSRLVSAHLSRWLDWWPGNKNSVPGLWTAIEANIGNGVHKEVKKVIVVAYFWTLWMQRNSKAFEGCMKKEKEICGDIQFMAYDWIRYRSNFGKSLNWENWFCNPLDDVSSCIALAPR